MLDLPPDTDKSGLAAKLLTLNANETAEQAMKHGLVLTALRSFVEWYVVRSWRLLDY